MWFEIGSILICATHNGQTIYPDTTTFCPVIVGVDEIIKDELKVKVSPNPFLDYFEINLSKHLDEAVISIYNLWGQEVSTLAFQHTDQLKVERNHLNSGFYFYRIRSGEKIISTGKIIAE